jgi:dihydrofolate reductase
MIPKITMVVAMSMNNVIGKEGKLPWNIPSELRHFKAVTTGKVVVMGRKTHESIGRLLPERANLVLTKDKDYSQLPGAIKVTSHAKLCQLLDVFSNRQEIYVIGGEEIYNYYLPVADEIIRTIVDAELDGDAYFPELDLRQWDVEDITKGSVRYAQDSHAYSIQRLIRKSSDVS